MVGTRQSFGEDVRAGEMPAAARVKRGFLDFLKRRAKAGGRQVDLSAPLAAYSSFADDGRDISLGYLLRQSAHAIDRGNALIAARGAALARAVEARSRVDVALATQGARLALALFWVFVGVILAREAALPHAGEVRGLFPDAAARLARVFVAIGVLGAVVAFVGAFLARGAAAGGGDRSESNLGAEAGAIAREFHAAIAALRARIGDDSAGAAAVDLSRLHFTALEATSFFQRIGFLTEPDHARAAEAFRRFLGERQPAAGGAAMPAFVLLVIGAAAGAGVFLIAAPGFVLPALPLWVLAASIGLGLLYAAMGLVFALAGGSAASSSGAKAHDEVLTQLRKAYVAAGAPRADDIIGEAEAALSDFTARIGAARRSHSADQQFDQNSDDLAWRRPPDGPRFVDQRFMAAPPVFRAETQANFPKNFFTGRGRNAAPKQSTVARETPPWLKD
jgi:hypothetical protein